MSYAVNSVSLVRHIKPSHSFTRYSSQQPQYHRAANPFQSTPLLSTRLQPSADSYDGFLTPNGFFPVFLLLLSLVRQTKLDSCLLLCARSYIIVSYRTGNRNECFEIRHLFCSVLCATFCRVRSAGGHYAVDYSPWSTPRAS